MGDQANFSLFQTLVGAPLSYSLFFNMFFPISLIFVFLFPNNNHKINKKDLNFKVRLEEWGISKMNAFDAKWR